MNILIVDTAEEKMRSLARVTGSPMGAIVREVVANGMAVVEARAKGRRVFVEDAWGRRWEITEV